MTIDTQLPTQSRPSPGFFESFHCNINNFKAFVTSKKAHIIATLLLCSFLVTGITALFFVTLTTITALGAFILASQIAGYVIVPVIAVKSIIKWLSLDSLIPPIGDLPFSPSAIGSPKVGDWHKGALKAYPLKNAHVSNHYKLELMRNAKESIVLSGCYCGGEIFQEALEIIKGKLEKGELKEVKILSTTAFLTKENRQLLEELERDYKGIFQSVVHSENMFTYNAERNHLYFGTSNHTKILVVDGSYAITGGSGLQDPWIKSEKITKNKILPDFFQDSDYLLRSDRDGIVPLIYSQFQMLFSILTKRYVDPNVFEKVKAAPFELPYHAYEIDAVKNGLRMKNGKLKKIKEFSIDAAKVTTGFPQQGEKYTEKELIQMLQSAKKTVFISHMYFCPTKRLFRAMKEALSRGISFTFIRNGHTSQSPYTHYLYVALNNYYIAKLSELSKDGQIKVFENKEPRTTWHQKVFIVDEETMMFGSTNISYNGLKGGDYELSVIVKSKNFVKQALEEIYKQAKKGCEVIPKDKVVKLGFFTRLLGNIQHYVFRKII